MALYCCYQRVFLCLLVKGNLPVHLMNSKTYAVCKLRHQYDKIVNVYFWVGCIVSNESLGGFQRQLRSPTGTNKLSGQTRQAVPNAALEPKWWFVVFYQKNGSIGVKYRPTITWKDCINVGL